jgi:cytochrome c553
VSTIEPGRTLIVMSALALACSGRSEKTASASQILDARSAPVAPVAPPDASLRDHMDQHLGVVQRLQEAVVRGRLDEARASARWIAEHPEHLELADAAARVAEMRATAQALVDAPDLREVASQLASLGRVCARCHEERGAITTFAWEPEPPDGDALTAQMRRHQWASARLWEGVIGPSDGPWRDGAKAMARMRLDVGALAAGPHGALVREASTRVRSLASQAAGLEDNDARANLYREMLEACVACHQAVRPTPAPMP